MSETSAKVAPTSQPQLSSSSCLFLRELTSRMFDNILQCGSIEEIKRRASTIRHDIDEICVKNLPGTPKSNHSDETCDELLAEDAFKNIDETCVAALTKTPVSNHINDQDNHDNNEVENPTKSSKISVSISHQIDVQEYREKSELLANLREMKEKITHEKIFLLSIGEYVKRENFFPPYIADLIALSDKLARNSKEGCLCDYNVPFILEEREKLLKFFYQEAYERAVPSERDRKIIFTLTILRMLKNLGDSIFTSCHPRNRTTELRLSFILPSLFFAIPYYKFIFDWFNFDCDSIAMQLLFVKFMEIKIANETAAWTKFVRPMTFENAVLLFGKVNPFHKRALAAPMIKCIFNMIATSEMIESIKEFLKTGDFEWKSASKKFAINFEFSCPRNRVGE